MQRLLASAIQLHQAGQLAPAGELYRRVLAQTPDDADALHLLGVVHLQCKEPARALELLKGALALRPDAPEFYVNLSQAHRALRQDENAVACCEQALRLRPGFAEAQHNLDLARSDLAQRERDITYLRRLLQVEPNAEGHSSLAQLLRQLGRVDEALGHFLAAAELCPADAVAQANLGQMLLSLERIDEALPYCRQAAHLQPEMPLLQLILGDALRLAGHFDDARCAYEEAIGAQPALARAHAHLGMTLHTAGKIDDAFGPLRQAVALAPNEASFWRYLAQAHLDAREPHAALQCWQRALTLQPGQAAFLLGLGATLQALGQFEEAERHLRAAAHLRPDSAEAHVALGQWHQDMGQARQAEDAFRVALTLNPKLTLAHTSLARLLGGRLPAADRRAIDNRFLDARMPDRCRALLHGALVEVDDQRGNHAAAADHARQANALTSTRIHRCGGYDPAAHRRFVDASLQAFNAEFFQRGQDSGVTSERPVFILGLPRSGTSLVEQILSSHLQVHGAGELRLGWQSFRSIPAALGRTGDPLASVHLLDSAVLARLAQQHLAWLAPHGGSAARVTDKMPDNYEYLGLLARMFPQATFIHCRRDLRDVALSCWLTHFQFLDWTTELDHIVARIEDYRRLMEHWRSVLPATLHEVDYEDVVADLEGVARRLVAACGLPWDPACLEFHRQRRPVQTASAQQVRRPIYTRAVGRWRNYEQELRDLIARVA